MIAGLNVCLLTALPEVISFICAAVGEPLWHKASSPYQPQPPKTTCPASGIAAVFLISHNFNAQ